MDATCNLWLGGGHADYERVVRHDGEGEGNSGRASTSLRKLDQAVHEINLACCPSIKLKLFVNQLGCLQRLQLAFCLSVK